MTGARPAVPCGDSGMAAASDALVISKAKICSSVLQDVKGGRYEFPGKKRLCLPIPLGKEHKKARKSVPVGDFWSRVDSRNIPIDGMLKEYIESAPLSIQKAERKPTKQERIVEKMHSLTEAELESIYPNYGIITTCVADYSYKTTPFGDVYYSPRFQDEKYIYRYVILTRGVKTEAYRILKNCGTFLLTEQQIIRELAIDLSPGWEHFMLFRNKLDELILRRRIGT